MGWTLADGSDAGYAGALLALEARRRARRTRRAGDGGPPPRAYAAYGRVFRAERAGAGGLWWAVGRGRGLPPRFLDRLGPRPDRASMQRALDAWAGRGGFREAE
jgi:hypothetical protein